MLCNLPTASVAQGISVAVSLNNGTQGTFSEDALLWTLYHSPTVLAINPSVGDANGGTNVTITGIGFTALSNSYAARQEFLRCRFGAQVQLEPPYWHNDSAIACMTTWGKQNDDGQLVSVALNSVSFSSRGSTRFVFKGLHKPALVDVVFPPEATTLTLEYSLINYRYVFSLLVINRHHSSGC